VSAQKKGGMVNCEGVAHSPSHVAIPLDNKKAVGVPIGGPNEKVAK
jgi:hypothetical protein